MTQAPQAKLKRGVSALLLTLKSDSKETIDLLSPTNDFESNDILMRFVKFSNVHKRDKNSRATQSNLSQHQKRAQLNPDS